MASAASTIILTVMSTRASLRFIDECANVVYVYRGHDGFPEIVEPDIDGVLSIAQGRWSCSEGLMEILSLWVPLSLKVRTRLLLPIHVRRRQVTDWRWFNLLIFLRLCFLFQT